MFTGREYDESGLYFYRSRVYDPKIGRFLQRDPIGYYDSMNLYSYAGNSPVNWIDPFGLCGEKPWWEKAWGSWSDFVAPNFNDPASFGANFWKEVYDRPPSLGLSITFGGMTNSFSTSGYSGSFTPTQLWGFSIFFQNRANLTNTMLYAGANEKLSLGYYPFDPGQWWEKSFTLNLGEGVGWPRGVDWQINPDRGVK